MSDDTLTVERTCRHCGAVLVRHAKEELWHFRRRLTCGVRCGARSRKRPVRPLALRFWAKVARDSPDACWRWTATRDGSGYGVFAITSRKLTKAHRMAWELAHGPVPDGLFVLHRCDNPPCVNPAHLFLGDAKANVADMDAKGRRGDTSGTRNGRAILDEERVRAIRRAVADGQTRTAVAAAVGVSRCTVGRIVNFEDWAHVR